MNYLDLFSGIGGFAIGAHNAGWRFDKHYFSEVDEYAIKVYRRRFPDAIPLGDITKIDGKALADSASTRLQAEWQQGTQQGFHVDSSSSWLITGGFPCTDISVAGKGAGITGRQSGLWFEMWRIIRELRPRYVIIENVAALTFRGLPRVLSSLAEIGYDAEWTDIRASDLGAPHRRERIWIVAYPGSERCEERQRAESVRQACAGAEHGSQDVADAMSGRYRTSEREIPTGRNGIINGNGRAALADFL